MSTDETPFAQERALRPEEYQAALDSARQENAELQDKYLRAVAASENTRKQAERVATARASQQLQRMYTHLLEVADNLERALSYAAENDPLAPGVRATQRQLLDLLLREGVTPVHPEPASPELARPELVEGSKGRRAGNKPRPSDERVRRLVESRQ